MRAPLQLYTMDKTGNTSENTTRTADAQTGDYTLSGTTGTSSTAIESNTHGTDTATFTEILAEDVATLSTEGNDQAGQYEMSESGTRSDNFVDDGTNATGSFHVTEGSSGSFDSTTTGDDNNGATSVVETSNTGYSVTQTVSGSNPFTMTENGTETATANETDDSVTGDYTRTENGTDVYTLGETGTLSGAFSDTVTGTDGYASTETGNHAMQTYARTTTGGGTWTRTASGGTLTSGNGTNGYTLTESGDSAAGHFSQSETGTDRYGLVEKFDDVSSNANGAATPGNVTFHSHGLPFRDPELTDEQIAAALADPVFRAKVAQFIHEKLGSDKISVEQIDRILADPELRGAYLQNGFIRKMMTVEFLDKVVQDPALREELRRKGVPLPKPAPPNTSESSR